MTVRSATARIGLGLVLAMTAPANAIGVGTPLGPGRYCQDEAVTGFVGGTNRDVALGHLLMVVDVKHKKNGYSVAFANRLPDNPQILAATSHNIRIARDGSLTFTSADGWDNVGTARLRPTATITLTMTRKSTSSFNQIGRNYGDFTLSARACRSRAIHQFTGEANVDR